MRTLILIALSAALAGCGTTPFYMGQQPSTEFGRSVNHMPERVRASIATVSVQPGNRTPTLYVGGDYGDPGPDVGDSAKAGAADGARFTGELIAEDPRAIIVVPFVLPLAMIAGSIAGAAGAKIEQQIRKYRDALTDDMLDESSPRLPSAKLAEELRGFVGRVGDVELVDTDADATLTITLSEIAIIIEGNDADMTATARVLLTDREGQPLYSNSYDYTDRDTLSNWTKDDNALWVQFTDNARRHIARLASESMFQLVATRHVLRPRDNDWKRRAKTPGPMLAWDFVLLGGDEFDATDIADRQPRFDLEVYDGTRVVYAAHNIEGPEHTVAEPLPDCRTLGWTVRPILTIDGRERAGEWMRRASAGERAFGVQGATFSGGHREYWDGFAKLTTRCAK